MLLCQQNLQENLFILYIFVKNIVGGHMKLKEKRQFLNKTQEEVAKDLNLQKQTYQNYEYGKREPDIATLKKLADYFCVSVDYLIEHNCKNKIDLTSLTEEQQESIQLIQQLSQENCKLLNAYANGLMEAQKKQDELIKKFTNLN